MVWIGVQLIFQFGLVGSVEMFGMMLVELVGGVVIDVFFGFVCEQWFQLFQWFYFLFFWLSCCLQCSKVLVMCFFIMFREIFMCLVILIWDRLLNLCRMNVLCCCGGSLVSVVVRWLRCCCCLKCLFGLVVLFFSVVGLLFVVGWLIFWLWFCCWC